MEPLMSMRIGAFDLNVAAGLEDSIIRELNPPWNNKNKEVLLQDDADWVFAPIALPPARPPEPTPAAAPQGGSAG
jgi:hypothetical protein